MKQEFFIICCHCLIRTVLVTLTKKAIPTTVIFKGLFLCDEIKELIYDPVISQCMQRQKDKIKSRSDDCENQLFRTNAQSYFLFINFVFGMNEDCDVWYVLFLWWTGFFALAVRAPLITLL